MPQTQTKKSKNLSIQLINPASPLYPGSVIHGHVVRDSHVVAPNATIRISLLGRAKAKLVVDRGNNTKSYYRSRFDFWRGGSIADVVHLGPVHIAQGPGNSQSWPFALTLPTHSDAAALNEGLSDNERAACFLRVPGIPGGKVRVPEHALPASFFYEHSGFGKSWHGFVEYWLAAELQIDGKSRVIEAALPLRKSQKFFGSSKIPMFYFSLRVEYPTQIQLGNPHTIPFRLRVTPDRERSSEVIQDVPQKVLIKSAVLEVHSTTEVICPGTFDTHQGSKTRKLCIGRKNKLISEADEMEVPCAPDEGVLDLGAVLGLQIDARGSVVGASRFGVGLHEILSPTYTTYCIRLSHILKWEIEASIRGEPWRCEWHNTITVLPPVDEALTGGVGAASTAGATSSLKPPPPVDEAAPPYEGPRTAVPAYEKVDGGDASNAGSGNGEGPSTVSGATNLTKS
ncbi:hypothetical protein Cob_v004507 [Colletotrichum orbiculare MAFF 240422]|uniref:Arrestin-like N-terminal domain-containing protein n=1 Tax=Colletotrichum orbiculare (strain 104-T / ATCC 96160 / CBS 514.97 / LARS 414 / MAFF 240422) TaxID=1213857 RepID=A0A484FXD4_COLOR|nr:hypothetical protein Cob_v004507 [Colletotrichum orbiculare MAFF 240422]